MAAFDSMRKKIMSRWVLFVVMLTVVIFTLDMGAHLTRQQYLSYRFTPKTDSHNMDQEDKFISDRNKDDYHIAGRFSEYALNFFAKNLQSVKKTNVTFQHQTSTSKESQTLLSNTILAKLNNSVTEGESYVVTTPRIPGLESMDRDLSLPPEIPKRPNSKEPILEYSQQRDYPSLITQNNICGDGKSLAEKGISDFDFENDVFLVMVVKTACAYDRRRDALRQTWGNIEWAKRELDVNIRLVFLLGACRSNDLQAKVLAENEKSHDLLQWDFFDSFRNLTLKECLFLQWFSKSCSNVPYIFKGDDDIIANTRNLVGYLKDLRPERRRDLFVGSVLRGSPRILDPTWKYYVSYNLYPEKYYPPYVSGGGFMMSGDIAKRLLQASLLTRIIPIDDAFVGILLKKIGVEPQNEKGFKSWGVKNLNDCRMSKIMTHHKLDPPALIRQWNSLQSLDPTSCGKDTDDVFRNNMRKRSVHF